MARWSESPKRRIDARPKNSEGYAQDVRGAHRDTGGRLIGGYMPQIDGSEKAFGTKSPGGKASGLDRWHAMNPNAGKFGEKAPAPPAETAPAPEAAPAAASTRMPSGSKTATRGLDRWAAMNPNAKKPFTPGSPSNPAPAAAPAGPSPAQAFVQAAMPKAPMPSPVPVAGAGPASTVASPAMATPARPVIPQPTPARVVRKRSPWSVSPLAKR